MTPGRRAVITGASSGIGAATAHALAKAGWETLLVGRDEGRLQEVARHTGGAVLVADLTAPDGVTRVAAQAAEADLLVNNAGIGRAGPVHEMGSEDIAELVAVNLIAPVQLTRAVLPGMRQRRRGHVVFVSSVAALGVPNEAVYAATKAGLRIFAASVRHECAPHGIGVTTLLPAAVRTRFFAGRRYTRRYPRQLAPHVVADVLVRAIEADAEEVFVPRWLTLAARVQGVAPGVFARLARRSIT